MQIKSLSDTNGSGVGQLLMSTVMAAVKQQSCVFAINMHPQAVSNAVYPLCVCVGGGGEIRKVKHITCSI